MDDTSTTTATLDQADEEILTYDVSDEALEAAADVFALSASARSGPVPWCC
jgi:hypothetical protein